MVLLNMVVIGFTLTLTCLSGLVGGFTREEWITKTDSIELVYDMKDILHKENKLVSIHTQDVIVMSPGFPAVIGIDDYRKALHENQTAENHYWSKTSEEPLYYTDDMAIMHVVFDYKLTQESELKTGKAIVFLRKVEGQALIRLDIWNYNS